MPSVAYDKSGTLIDAERIDPRLWESMKSGSAPGDYLMPCCHTPAILKTSPNGLPFFAHYNDECKTAPETAWHQSGKALIRAKLASMDIACREEVPGGTKEAPWQADTLFQFGSRTIVVELQRSYQHLRDYIRRQERYASCGVESYWLTRRENFITVIKATGQLRLKRDLGGKFPPEGFFSPLLPELPIAYLELGESARVGGPAAFSASVEDWLRAIVERRFVFDDGRWIVR